MTDFDPVDWLCDCMDRYWLVGGFAWDSSFAVLMCTACNRPMKPHDDSTGAHPKPSPRMARRYANLKGAVMPA